MNKLFLIIGSFHITLVMAFMVIFDYQQISDSIRYIAVANEFASFKFQFSPSINCNTAPGYPLFLAIIKPFTWDNMFLIAVIQSILFIVSFWYFLFQIKLRYEFTDFAIIFLTIFVLFNPEIIHLNGSTLTESLTATLILFVSGSLVNFFRKKYDNFIFVLCFSFLVLTKMEYVLLLLVLIPFLFFIKKNKTILITLVTLFSLLFLNGLKNQNTYSVFKMTSFGAGDVIYGGNNLNLDGSWHTNNKTKNYLPEKYENLFDSIHKLEPVCYCIKQDSLYKKMAIEAWEKSYTDQIKVIPIKLGKLWLLPGGMDFYSGQKLILKGLQLGKLFSDELWPWYGKWKHGAYLLVYWVSLILSIIGLYIKVNYYRFDKVDFLIISILLVNTVMYSIPFYGLGRFHLPVLSILFYYAIYVYIYYEKRNKRNIDSDSKIKKGVKGMSTRKLLTNKTCRSLTDYRGEL